MSNALTSFHGTSVKIEHLTKQFGQTVAVEDFNLQIQEGEFLTLLGPSGCGKTTLLSMLLGIFEPSGGSIYFGAELINQLPMRHRDVGMVFQNYALFPHMTVEKNVEFGLEMRKIPRTERKSRVNEALAMVQLENYANRYPRELSGGQQQRVALARAIVVRPKVLLLDEPLSNLDAKLRQDMRIQLKRLHHEVGITTIYVTHDQEEALSLSTKVAVMSKGKLQQEGSPKEIFLNPKNHFVADFLGYRNFISGKISEIIDQGYEVCTSQGICLNVKSHLRYQIGDTVTLTIKPEHIQVTDQIENANFLQGLVQFSDYIGSITSYDIETEIGLIHVRDMGIVNHNIGQPIHLYLPSEHIIILEEAN